jgi:hypothetical protein
VESVTKSLRLIQFFRLLKSDDPKSMGHVGFWMGNLMEDFVVQFRGMTSAEVIPAFLCHYMT